MKKYIEDISILIGFIIIIVILSKYTNSITGEIIHNNETKLLSHNKINNITNNSQLITSAENMKNNNYIKVSLD